MDYELLKKEIIKLKKNELDYIYNITCIAYNMKLSESKKLDIYRTLNKYKEELMDSFQILYYELIKNKELSEVNYKEELIEFDVDENFLSLIKFDSKKEKKQVLNDLGIDEKTFKYKLNFEQLIHDRAGYKGISYDKIMNNQQLIEKPIYIFLGFHDTLDEYYVPTSVDRDDYMYGKYVNIINLFGDEKEIPKKGMFEFEKDKGIIYSKNYVTLRETQKIFNDELLNDQNRTIDDCINSTRNRIEELNYTRSPEYKEIVLLNRIKELYQKINSNVIREEILYSDSLLEILKETCKLSNGTIVEQEKVIKNNEKDSVVVIGIDPDKKYIVISKKKVNENVIAEFPSGNIEQNEIPTETAKRILKEEIGYSSDDLFIVDEAYTSPKTDNSKTYIVIANNCIKKDENKVNYELFNEKEIAYLINYNIINGAMNKLAYYNLVNNVEHCNEIIDNKKIYLKRKKRYNPLH